MAKVRKRNNNIKRYQVQAENSVSGLAFGMLPDAEQRKVECWRLSTGKIYPVGPTVARAMGECHFKFAFCLLVISIESNGKERYISEFERMAAPYRHVSLVDYLNERHGCMMKAEEAKGNKVVGAGWLCVPVPKLSDDELYEKMLDILTADC